MQFSIESHGLGSQEYKEFSEFVFNHINNTLDKLIDKNSLKYQVRIDYINNFFKFKYNINLKFYIKRCLQLKFINGTYVIKLDDYHTIRGTKVLIKDLVRALEYGIAEIPPLPVVRTLINNYSQNYQILINEFLEEKLK